MINNLKELIAHRNTSALQEAIKNNVDFSAKDNYGETLLHYAALHRSKDAIPLILKQKVNINDQNNYGMTALHKAADLGFLDIVKLLINNGANINLKDKKGKSILHYTVWSPSVDNFKTTKFLIEKLQMDIHCIDNEGNTPLFFASSRIIPYLLEKGANIKIKNKIHEDAWLYFTNYYDYFDILPELSKTIDQFIRAGININSKNQDKYTALHYAAECGYSKIITQLLTSGADKNVKNNEGKIAIDLCTNQKLKSLFI